MHVWCLGVGQEKCHLLKLTFESLMWARWRSGIVCVMLSCCSLIKSGYCIIFFLGGVKLWEGRRNTRGSLFYPLLPLSPHLGLLCATGSSSLQCYYRILLLMLPLADFLSCSPPSLSLVLCHLLLPSSVSVRRENFQQFPALWSSFWLMNWLLSYTWIAAAPQHPLVVCLVCWTY